MKKVGEKSTWIALWIMEMNDTGAEQNDDQLKTVVLFQGEYNSWRKHHSREERDEWIFYI